MKLQLCIFLMVLATVARSMNLPGDVMAVNEETFVAVEDKDAFDSQSKDEDALVSDSDMSDMGRLHLELDLLNAENEADMASVAQNMDQEQSSENDNKLHLDLDLLNADQTTVAQEVEQNQVPEDENKLHLELDLLNGDQTVEEEATVASEMNQEQEQEQEQEPENENKLHLELDLLSAEQSVEEKNVVSQEESSENESKLHLELDLLNDETVEVVTVVPADDNKLHLELDLLNGNLPSLETVNDQGKECGQEGLSAVENDCHKYVNCSAHNPESEQLTEMEQECPENEAFHLGWNRCRRDLGKCTDNKVNCIVDGALADPESTTSYYLCSKSLSDDTFHLFHVKCKTGEVYLPALGKCFIDLTDFANAYQSYDWTAVSDFEVVKQELAEYRFKEKMELKIKKEEAKMQKKLQKELEKLAKKKAKEEAKKKTDLV